ncbi:MAG: hypothetical protein J3R72DRAFT_452279 [Linnemannia gamsii]|nr:MAG: hypothetical protein J3R72DRAFT_452279 [Linnemannia gamsii]
MASSRRRRCFFIVWHVPVHLYSSSFLIWSFLFRADGSLQAVFRRDGWSHFNSTFLTHSFRSIVHITLFFSLLNCVFFGSGQNYPRRASSVKVSGGAED